MSGVQATPVTPPGPKDLAHPTQQTRMSPLSDHNAYDYDWIVRHAKLVVDTRNATAAVKPNRAKHALSREGIIKA